MTMVKTRSTAFLLIPVLFCFMLTSLVEAGPFFAHSSQHYKPHKRSLPQQYLGPETSLIRGDSLEGWTTIAGKTPPAAWSVTDGVLHLKGKGGDIASEREYENFILDFSWSIARGGNSGIKYRFMRYEGKGWLGLEYQVLDDFNAREGLKPKNNTSTFYDIKSTNSLKKLNPNTEKNYGRIVVNGKRLEHWLNGEKVGEMLVGSEEWKKLVAESKFNGIEGFGENSVGRITVQDHNCEVWFHKISIREIIDTQRRYQGENSSACISKPCSQKDLGQKTTRCVKTIRKPTSYRSTGYKTNIAQIFRCRTQKSFIRR